MVEFLHKIFGISNDTAATILVTLLTFISGILITIVFNAIKDYLKRRTYRKLLKLNLRNLLRGLFKQAVGYERFYKQIDIDYTNAFDFEQKSISAVGVFQQIGYENLYNALFNGFENTRLFNNNKRINAYNNLWSTIDFLIKFHDKSFAEGLRFIELNSEYNEQRNLSLGKAQRIIEAIRLRLHAEEVPRDLGIHFNSIEDIIVKLKEQKNFRSPRIMEFFYVQEILSLNRLNVGVIKKYREILHPVELNAELLETSLRYVNQKNLIDAYNAQFRALADSFNNNYHQMKKSYRILCK